MATEFPLPTGMAPSTFDDLIKLCFGMTTSDVPENEAKAIAATVAQIFVNRIHDAVRAEQIRRGYL